ncbi:hypothetical protein DSY14_00335 [Nocardiopsis sp. MG754419]|nr:hypothetical protein [Nocardiopsis sp. MG754419]
MAGKRWENPGAGVGPDAAVAGPPARSAGSAGRAGRRRGTDRGRGEGPRRPGPCEPRSPRLPEHRPTARSGGPSA